MQLHAIMLTALAALLSTPSGFAQEACCDLFAPVSGELVLAPIDRGDPSASLQVVVDRYAELTGQHVYFSQETGAQLRSMDHGIHPAPRVPADQVQAWFEQLLASNGFAVAVLRRAEPRLLQVVPLGERWNLGADRVWVPSDHVEHMREHVATLFTTVLSMPNTDVRQLSTSLRGLLTSVNTGFLIPLTNANSLMMSGFGGHLANLVEMFGRFDAASGPGPMPAVRAAASIDLFGQASGDLELVVADTEAPTLDEILDRYARVMGLSISRAPETAALLASSRPVQKSIVIPASEVQSYVEHLVVAEGFAMTIRRTDAPRLIEIESIKTGAPGIRAAALAIDEAEVPDHAAHPAVMVMASVTLESLDARVLSSVFRSVITDPTTQQFLPLGTHSNGITVVGFGDWVAGVVKMLRTADAATQRGMEMVTEVVLIEHAVALEVHDAVQEYLESPAMFFEPEASLSIDVPSNTLVITASRKCMVALKERIARLDVEADSDR